MTLLPLAPAAATVQVITIEELASVSTRVSGVGAVTVNRQSRTRFSVAWSFQCTWVPAPVPPARTSYSLYCAGSSFGRVTA